LLGLDVHEAKEKMVADGFLDDKQAGQLMAAVQKSATTTVLASPRVLTFDGQRATVSVVNQRPYVGDLKAIKKDGQTALEPVIKYVDEGLVFDVQGTVSNDRKFVTLTLRPKLTALVKMETLPFTKIPDEMKDIRPQPSVQRPIVDVREFATTISVPDNHTLIIKGHALNRAAGKEGRVPVLSDIPLLKAMFENRGSVGGEQTLLILVKPKIVMKVGVDAPEVKQ
jgi:general secretion pathway protein D